VNIWFYTLDVGGRGEDERGRCEWIGCSSYTAEHLSEMRRAQGESSAGKAEKKGEVAVHEKGQRLWFTDRAII
jgi:hypothetical protein